MLVSIDLLSSTNKVPVKNKRVIMPLITINVIESVFTDEQKSEMIRKVTDAMVSIEGEAMRGVTWVLIEDVSKSNWGIGGQNVTNIA